MAGDHDMEREEDRINWVLCRSSHMGGLKKKKRVVVQRCRKTTLKIKRSVFAESVVEGQTNL